MRMKSTCNGMILISPVFNNSMFHIQSLVDFVDVLVSDTNVEAWKSSVPVSLLFARASSKRLTVFIVFIFVTYIMQLVGVQKYVCCI